MSDPHPYFDDRGALPWHHRFADAVAEAAASGRRLFVLSSSRDCGGSRALVEKTIPKDEIADYIRQHFVALAVEPGALEPELAGLVSALPRRTATPLCLYLALPPRLVYSTVGGRPAAVFLQDLVEATARK